MARSQDVSNLLKAAGGQPEEYQEFPGQQHDFRWPLLRQVGRAQPYPLEHEGLSNPVHVAYPSHPHNGFMVPLWSDNGHGALARPDSGRASRGSEESTTERFATAPDGPDPRALSRAPGSSPSPANRAPEDSDYRLSLYGHSKPAAEPSLTSVLQRISQCR